jgi:hypothetical protein
VDRIKGLRACKIAGKQATNTGDPYSLRKPIKRLDLMSRLQDAGFLPRA